MKIREKIKKLKWLLAHEEEIEKLIEKPKKKEKNYSLLGVPDYQINYINDLLDDKK